MLSARGPSVLFPRRLQRLEVSLSAAAFVLAACEASEERREPRAPRVLDNGSSALGGGVEVTQCRRPIPEGNGADNSQRASYADSDSIDHISLAISDNDAPLLSAVRSHTAEPSRCSTRASLRRSSFSRRSRCSAWYKSSTARRTEPRL